MRIADHRPRRAARREALALGLCGLLVSPALRAEHAEPDQILLHLVGSVREVAQALADPPVDLLGLGARPTGEHQLLPHRGDPLQELPLLLPQADPRLEVGQELLLAGQVGADVLESRLEIVAFLVPRFQLVEHRLGPGAPRAQLLQRRLARLDRPVRALALARIERMFLRELVEPLEERVLDLLVVGLDGAGDEMAELRAHLRLERALVDERGLAEEARVGEPEPAAEDLLVLRQLGASAARIRDAPEERGLRVVGAERELLDHDLVRLEVAAEPVASGARREDDRRLVRRLPSRGATGSRPRDSRSRTGSRAPRTRTSTCPTRWGR